MSAQPIRHDLSLLGPDDMHLFNEGTHYRAYRVFGSHLLTHEGHAGTHFAVWAPNAGSVSVMGDFNGWSRDTHPLRPTGSTGVWEGFVPGLGRGTVYKYAVRSRDGAYLVDKADPYAIHAEVPPNTGSVVWDLDYAWSDAEWMTTRPGRHALTAPMSIYEVHLGSWMRRPEEGYRSLSYREIATRLADHCERLGFTHVELLPVTEHPFFGSWGYQTTGYFAPTSRYGTPQDFMFFVDHLHQRGIGVILDWVPSHFPTDGHGLSYFDGTHLYEHADPRQGFHQDWKSYVFNYGRHEVRSFLLSSALYWLDVYHLDGLRVDAVASMLYLDYSRKEGEWIPNQYGGRENLEAIHFLRQFNEAVYREHPGVQTFAEESTAWPMVSRPVYVGGLGFGLKWDMGWMHDTLKYMSLDPVHRKYHHNQITFRMLYAFHENFVMPLSHDEVVHGKGSLLGKMPGGGWDQFANLRTLYGYMYGQAGKKLLFMGAEFGQRAEWNHDGSLDWGVLEHESHAGIVKWVSDLNRLYRAEPALHERDCDAEGFRWVDCNDAEKSLISFTRRGRSTDDIVLVVCNFTPVPRENYRLGVPRGGYWKEVLNSDAAEYWGQGFGNMGGVEAAPVPSHGLPHTLVMTLPPLSVVFFKSEAPSESTSEAVTA
ncbi:MAG: alpha-1,4-glucan:alpha-1,4-glucan 6-glycosyltransferase [Acidobacteria bacterium]|nr:alpha-1,4-glucan:alpha-1,4-glucan 6-glycosyltransferase [Acidobacteriota bacterium]